MTFLIRWMGLLWLLAILHLPSSILAAETSSPPANVEFVPVPQASTIAKHPALPVLYVGCWGYPEQKNLITFHLADDGTLLTNSLKVCDDYFSTDGKKPEFQYRIVPRPAVMPKCNALMLACWPDNPTAYLANSNNNLLATVSLDDYGQPTGLRKGFNRTYTGEQIIAARAEATSHRLYVAYYVYFGWFELDENCLLTAREFTPLPVPINQWYWAYVPQWRRFFTMPPSPTLTILQTATDFRAAEFAQSFPAVPGSPAGGSLEVSESLRKLYVLGTDPGRELSVYSLSRDGRLIGLPRSFGVGPAYFLRVDSKAKKLYAMTNEWLRVWPLDAEGYPTGQPTLHSLCCGTIRDALMDEATGKLYIASTDPPKLAK